MPEQMDLIKLNSINRYVKQILKMRISKTAAVNLTARFNELLKTILKEGQDLAKKDDRNTIMPRDTETAVEDNLGKKNLTWEKIFAEITSLNAIDLGNLSKEITKYIEQQKQNQQQV